MNFVRTTLLAFVASVAGSSLVLAAENPSAEKKHGYTVTFEIKVNEKGEEETLKIVESQDTTSDQFIDRMATALALNTDLPVREKDGKPIAYTARVPFFIPIEGDEGAEANNLPRPIGTGALTVPLYPDEMRAASEVGGVIFEMRIDATGKLTKLTTLRASHPEFEAAARETLEKWQFRPAEADGQPVPSRWNIGVVFEMDGKFVDLKYRVPPRPSLGVLKIIPNSERGAEGEAAAPEAPAGADAEKK